MSGIKSNQILNNVAVISQKAAAVSEPLFELNKDAARDDRYFLVDAYNGAKLFTRAVDGSAKDLIFDPISLTDGWEALLILTAANPANANMTLKAKDGSKCIEDMSKPYNIQLASVTLTSGKSYQLYFVDGKMSARELGSVTPVAIN